MTKKEKLEKLINQDWDYISYEQIKKLNEQILTITIADIHESIQQYEEDSNHGN